jgi:hypothetical protein
LRSPGTEATCPYFFACTSMSICPRKNSPTQVYPAFTGNLWEKAQMPL